MNNTFYPANDYRNYLEHHGVKGMKWGVRHERLSLAMTRANHKAKGFFRKRANNFVNLQNYKRIQADARKKFDLDQLSWEADNEDARNEAARTLTNETLSRSGSYKRMSYDYNPYGSAAGDKYRKASADAEKYVKDTFIKEYGDRKYAQAKNSEMAYLGLEAVALIGFTVGISAISNKR